MAVRPLLLIALAAWVVLGGRALAAGLSCMKCHPSHYSALGSCVGCHRGDPRSDRPRVAHHDLIPARFSWYALSDSPQVRRGKNLLDTFACRRCHTTAGKGNRPAADLDRLPTGTTPQKMFDAVKEPALMMPEFSFDDRQLIDIVNALEAGAKEAERGAAGKRKEPPQVVHFQPKGMGENVFEKRCGQCHRVLTGTFGGLGEGSIGPNLSGLLTDHYPRTAPGRTAWSAESLRKWLTNPRSARENTAMRPVRLQKGEWEKLIVVLADSSAPSRR